MTVLSLATRAFGRRLGTLPASPTRGRDAQLRRLLGWSAPVGAAFAALAAAAGAALGDRPTVLGALAVLAIVAMLALLLQGLATSILAHLDAATTDQDNLQAELDAAHEAKEALRELAYHDDLTGLPTRTLLYDRLGLAITQSHREGTQLALLFLDLDDFKTVNDSFGHGSGDRLLLELATRVRGSVRAGDTVARFGGDEFVVLLDSVTGPEDAGRVAAKVLDAVQAPFRLDGQRGRHRGQRRRERVPPRRHVPRRAREER